MFLRRIKSKLSLLEHASAPPPTRETMPNGYSKMCPEPELQYIHCTSGMQGGGGGGGARQWWKCAVVCGTQSAITAKVESEVPDDFSLPPLCSHEIK